MRTVRNGQKVWPYCSSCGCRLNFSLKTYLLGDILLSHYAGFYTDEDARGCRCDLLNKSWFATKSKIYSNIFEA